MTDNIQEEIEDKIIDTINSGAGGRLVIFKPEKKGFEDFLAVERRGKYKEKVMYFEVNGFIGPSEHKDLVKDFPQESFKSDSNFYLLFVYFDEIEQKINDYAWLLSSSQFRDIAKLIKSPEGKAFLRFQAPANVKEKSEYSKFLIETKKLGKLILEAFEKKGRLAFKKLDFKTKKNINLETLKEFLCAARKNTYAGGASPVDNPRLLSSKELGFQRGDYFYRDVYFSGDKRFMGQEIIYQESKPVWGMNYVGDQIGKIETDFLKEALFNLYEKCRLGGVCKYEKRELKYQDNGQGDIENFSGTEEIFADGENIYKLNYQGGLISEKI